MKPRNYLLFLLSIATLSGCTNGVRPVQNQPIEPPNQTIVERSYDEINEYRIFWSDIFHQVYPLYFVYLYSETCSHCKSIKDKMIEYGVNQTRPIYFVESSPEHSLGEEFDKNEPVYDIDSLVIRGYPTLLRLEENVVVNIAEGTREILQELNI